MSTKRVSRRDVLKLAGLTGAATVLASCGPGKETATQAPAVVSGEPLEIKIWHMETPANRVEVMQGLIDAFNVANPDIVVAQETINWGEAYAKVASAIQAGNQADLQFTTPAHMHSVMPLGAIQPIDSLFNEIHAVTNFFENMHKPFTFEGHVWAIPLFGLTHLMVYRTDLLGALGFPEGPKTWDEWLQVAAELTGGDKYAITLPASTHLYTDQCVSDFMITNKGDIFTPEGALAFNSVANVEAFSAYRDMYQYSPPDAPSMTWPEANASFLTGQSAMTLIFGAIFARLPGESPDFADEVASAPIPLPPGGQMGCIGNWNGVMILTDDTEKIDACGKFLKYMCEPDRHAALLANMQPGLYMPVSDGTANSDAYWDQEILQRYKQHILTAFEMSKYSVMYGFNHEKPHTEAAAIDGANMLAQTVQKMVIDGMEPEAAVEWGHGQMEELIS